MFMRKCCTVVSRILPQRSIAASVLRPPMVYVCAGACVGEWRQRERGLGAKGEGWVRWGGRSRVESAGFRHRWRGGEAGESGCASLAVSPMEGGKKRKEAERERERERFRGPEAGRDIKRKRERETECQKQTQRHSERERLKRARSRHRDR